jgi:hypothetical protein
MTDPKKEELIRSVSDFACRVQSTSVGERRLFRGQNTDQPLLPRIVRLANKKGLSLIEMKKIEKKMLERFRRESPPMLGDTNKPTDLELLSIAQHHGMPTRLLDWTADALAGLWFAVSAYPPNNEEHGVVWVLDGPNEKIFNSTDDIFNLDRTYFFQPSHLDRRITAQSAWLSIHRPGSKRRFLPLEEHQRYRDKLKQFLIPRGLFDSLRQELRLLGVSHASLFPDLSGLSADIEVDLIKSWRSLSCI